MRGKAGMKGRINFCCGAFATKVLLIFILLLILFPILIFLLILIVLGGAVSHLYP